MIANQADAITLRYAHDNMNLLSAPSMTSSTRRLSQTITDIVTSPSRSRSSSSPRSPSPTESQIASNTVTVHFEGGQLLIIRPNRIIRGSVKLSVSKPLLASQIRIKFRAEEIATAKVKEIGLESKIERIDQVTTTYFEVNTKVWGVETSDFSISPWEEIGVGEYEYPFALKFPNVNFPPSTTDPAGFSISYIWSAHVDGPCHSPGIRSKEYTLPYRPIFCAPADKEWFFNQTLISSDKKLSIANVKATLPRFAFCPDEELDMELQIESIPENLVVSGVTFSLFKCASGQLQLQRGVARKNKRKKIISGTPSVPGNNGSVKIPVNFHIPTRLVSPSFQSRHIRVYYELLFNIQFVNHQGGLLKSSSVSVDFTVPIGITNLPNHHLLHIPDLTSIRSYTQCKEAPFFFDPSLDEPANPAEFQELWAPTTASLNTPPAISPPNYFSLCSQPSQFMKQDREERVVFTSRLIKPGMASELGEPIAVFSENKDYTW